jgi:hypothetical protein
MFLFGIAYGLGLGLKFQILAGPGMGLVLGYDFYLEARRIRAKEKPRHWKVEVALGTLRALALAIGLMVITSWRIGLVVFLLYAVFLSGTYLLGWSPSEKRRLSKHPTFRFVTLWVSALRGLGSACCYWAALSLVSGMENHPHPLVSPLRVGLTLGGASYFVGCFSPWVEWWVERLSPRRLAAVGAAFAIIGFLIQALPNWIILFQ